MLLGLAAALAITTNASAQAAETASDTASPNYESSASPTAYTYLDCTSGECLLRIKTKTSNYPCSAEVLALRSAAAPALLYPNTDCSVLISGKFSEPLNDQWQGDLGVPCEMEAVQTMTVSFASGVNSVFNGSFQASATFKPTAINTTTKRVTKATITVQGGSGFPYPSPATGSIKASFNVSFGGLGLRTDCYAAARTGVTTVSSGTVVIKL